MKKQEKSGSDIDKAMAGAGSVNPRAKHKLHAQEPVAEKDEVKQAEDRQRQQNIGK